MGSFFGHALPGSFFIVFAVWWTIQIYRRYFQSIRKNKREEFISTPNFPILTKRGWVNVEAYAVVICCSIGMLVELVAATIVNHKLGAGNVQHGTMYFFFGLTSLASVVLPRLKVIPKCDEVVYLFLALSYTTEGLLFKFHLMGRSEVDRVLHTLLVYTIFASVIVTLLEMQHRENVLLPLSRAFLTILQGTWFWQAAFVLYPPFTDPWGKSDVHHNDQVDMDHEVQTQTQEEHEKQMNDHNKIMLTACAFTWHMAVILIFMTLCGLFIGLYYKRRGGIDEDVLKRNFAVHPKSGGYTPLQQNGLQDDDL